MRYIDSVFLTFLRIFSFEVDVDPRSISIKVGSYDPNLLRVMI